jgi:hypothetical protein
VQVSKEDSENEESEDSEDFEEPPSKKPKLEGALEHDGDPLQEEEEAPHEEEDIPQDEIAPEEIEEIPLRVPDVLRPYIMRWALCNGLFRFFIQKISLYILTSQKLIFCSTKSS